MLSSRGSEASLLSLAGRGVERVREREAFADEMRAIAGRIDRFEEMAAEPG